MKLKNIFAAFFLIAFVPCAGAFAECAAPAEGKCAPGCKLTASKCLPCQAGEFKAETSDAKECTACTAGSYCATEQLAAPTGPCAINHYCPASSTSAIQNACPKEYPNSLAGTGTIDKCYLNTTLGNYVLESGKGETECSSGLYCTGGIRVYYGGTNSTGGSTKCPAPFTSSGQGASKITQCFATCAAEYYLNPAIGCILCTDTDNFIGKYCPGVKDVYYKPIQPTSYGIESCTNAPTGASYTRYGGSENACPWEMSCPSTEYWDNSNKTCRPCPAGYYCDGIGVTQNTTKNAGNTACAGGMTSNASATQSTECYFKGGVAGTIFCDSRNGGGYCFNLPSDIPYVTSKSP